MTQSELTEEHQNILDVLRVNPDSLLREIHDSLIDSDNSKFDNSPEFGDGWNDERWEVKELRDDLDDWGFVTNDYQSWRITEEGRKQLP